MNYFKNYSKYLLDWIKLYRYIATVKEKKTITFYSEGRQYWLCYKGIIDEILKLGHTIYYVSSDNSDPGLNYSSKIISLSIDERYQRFIFFRTLETTIFITTTPDLGNYKDYPKSKKTDYFIYCQHALMSTHYAYNDKAFDNFDVIFCSGEYMIKEIRKKESVIGLKQKKLVKHGYSKLDFMIKEFKNLDDADKNQHIIFAPGWNGLHSLIENGSAEEYIEKILIQGHKLFFKPHPESLKRSNKEIDKIIDKFKHNDNFVFYRDTLSIDIVLRSSFLITDWSGISIEYAFATGNIVFYIDTPQKCVNMYSNELNLEAFESQIRNKIGYIWDGKSILSSDFEKINSTSLMKENIYNILNSDKVAAEFINNLLIEKE